MSIRILHTDDPNGRAQVVALKDELHGGNLVAAGEIPGLDVSKTVGDIIAEVAARRDDALVDFEQKYDGVELTPDTIRVPGERLVEAHRQVDKGFMKLIRRAAKNIREYQESIKVKAPTPLTRDGRTLSITYAPVEAVGVYVPGGKAIYPSTVLMTVVPAQVAGVGRIVIASPPTTKGDVNPLVLALAAELDVDDVYRLGGAQAIAALALGVEQFPRVDKIVGPGNAFVAEAKRRVQGWVSIDSIAGPSEVFIIADETANPAWVAADMLAQAEHDPGSAVLATPSAELADAVAKEIDEQLPELDREKAIRKAIEQYSLIAVTPHLAEACDLANAFAPEHLQIVVRNENQVLQLVRHAGAIFLGPHTPVPLGDYYAGPSHVLPTGGTARFFGPLSCNDFLVATSVIRYDAASLAADADDVIDFATREGLTAHARAIEIRKKD